MLLRNPDERESATYVIRILHTLVTSLNCVSVRSLSWCFIFKCTFRVSTVLVFVSSLWMFLDPVREFFFFFFCYSWAMSCHGLDGILFYSSVGSLKSVTRWLVQVRRTEDGFFYFMIFIHIIWSIFRWEVLILAEEFTVDLGSLRCGNWPPFFFVASIRCIRLKNACDTSAVVCLCMWNNTVIICSVVCG